MDTELAKAAKVNLESTNVLEVLASPLPSPKGD
jgi:hypothetical protein